LNPREKRKGKKQSRHYIRRCKGESTEEAGDYAPAKGSNEGIREKTFSISCASQNLSFKLVSLRYASSLGAFHACKG
jgi:hypothetical protein